MRKHLWSSLATVIAAAVFALTPVAAEARGGGHGGGGHGGGGHAGGGHAGGGGAHFAGGHVGGGAAHVGGFRGGYAGRGGYGGYGRGYGGYGRGYGGYGGYGWGYPGWGLGLGLGLGYPWYSDYTYAPSFYDNSDYYDTTPAYPLAPNYYPDSGPAYNTMPLVPSYGAAVPAAPAANNTAQISVTVPPNAQVWFNGVATQQRGQMRVFESPPLTPGRAFAYDIKAQWTGPDGRVVTQTREVDVRANANVSANFTRPAVAASAR